MTQPASRAAYCQSKSLLATDRIFSEKIFPYNLMGRGVCTLPPKVVSSIRLYITKYPSQELPSIRNLVQVLLSA